MRGKWEAGFSRAAANYRVSAATFAASTGMRCKYVKKAIGLSIVLSLLLSLLLPCAALAEFPHEEDADLYGRYAEELTALGFAVETEDVMSTSSFNYDGTEYMTISYAPIDGLTYNIDYEDDSLYMVYLAFLADTEAFDRAGDLILALLRLTDPEYTDDGSEGAFLAELSESGERVERGGLAFQIIDYGEDAPAALEALHAMVYFF